MGEEIKDLPDDSITWFLGDVIEFRCFVGWL